MRNRESGKTVLSRRRQTVLRKISKHVTADAADDTKNFTSPVRKQDVSNINHGDLDSTQSPDSGYLRKHDKQKLMKYLRKDVKQRNIDSLNEILTTTDSFSLADIDPNGILLTYAANFHYVDVMECLLSYNSPVGYSDTCGLSVLHQAVKYRRMDTLQVLLRHHVNVNQETLYEQKTSLHIAIKQNNLQLVLLLLSYGADPDKPDIYGCTPLHRAASFGYNDMVLLLLEHNADVNAVDRVTWTPLHHAAEMNHHNTVRILLQKKANICAQTKYGKTALHLACSSGRNRVVEVLMEFGCPTNIKDIHGKSAIEYTKNANIKSLVISSGNSSNNNNTSSEEDYPIKHIDMTLRSKSLIDLLEPDYMKQDYYDSGYDKTDMRCKSITGKSASKGMPRQGRRKTIRKTISKSLAKILGKQSSSNHSFSKPSLSKSRLPMIQYENHSRCDSVSFFDPCDISKISADDISGSESLERINSPSGSKQLQTIHENTPIQDLPIVTIHPSSTPRDKHPQLNKISRLGIFSRVVGLPTPTSSTPRESKLKFYTPDVKSHIREIEHPSSTPRYGKLPKQPVFSGEYAGQSPYYSEVGGNISMVQSVSDMDISAVASTCQYSNSHISDCGVSNSSLTELNNQYLNGGVGGSGGKRNRNISQSSVNRLNNRNNVKALKQKNRGGTPEKHLESIDEVKEVTDQCVSSISEVTHAINFIKRTKNSRERNSKLQELTTFLDQWASDTKQLEE